MSRFNDILSGSEFLVFLGTTLLH